MYPVIVTQQIYAANDVRIISVTMEIGLTNKYSDIVTQFSPFASVAAHNPKVFGILQASLSRLKVTQVTSNDDMPPCQCEANSQSIQQKMLCLVGNRRPNNRNVVHTIIQLLGSSKHVQGLVPTKQCHIN